MGSQRYTSPETSRLLAEAGLEQIDGSPAYINAHQIGEPSVSVTGCECGDCAGIVRALDLTDVLDELTRERDGGPLADAWGLQTYRGHHCMTVWVESRPVVYEAGSPVEAAALVLLALLRERKP